MDRQLALLLAMLLFVILAAIGGLAPVVALNVALLGAVQSVLPFGQLDWLSLVLVIGASQVSLPILAGLALLLLRQGKRLSAVSLGLILAGLAVEILLKASLGHPMIWPEFSRGSALYPFPEIKPEGLLTLSSPYPSGHMLRATFLTLILASALEDRLTRGAARIVGALGWGVLGVVSLGLLYLGWHWPTDVVGGLALGYCLATICRYAFERDRGKGGGSGYRLSRGSGRGTGARKKLVS